jgi:transposase-like protein
MRKRRTFQPEFKARVVLEELTGVKTAGQICSEHQLSPRVFARWKAEFVERAPEIFIRPKSRQRASNYDFVQGRILGYTLMIAGGRSPTGAREL